MIDDFKIGIIFLKKLIIDDSSKIKQNRTYFY